MTHLLQLRDEDSRYAVIVEIDSKVAYAYLLEGDDIVADVWLYNVAPPPDTPEWDDRDNAPFANPREFCQDEQPPRIDDPDKEVAVEWIRSDGDGVAVVVMIHGTTMARLEPGATPGWSRRARKDGPLARVLPPG